jgi:hypothetical protein
LPLSDGRIYENPVGSAIVMTSTAGVTVGTWASVVASTGVVTLAAQWSNGTPSTNLAYTVTGTPGSGSGGGGSGTAQTGDVFALINPMITSHVFTTNALANTPTSSQQQSATVTIPTGTVVAGSTGTAVIVSGLQAGKSYVGQHLYHIPSGEARTIASQSYVSGNYIFNFPGTVGTEAGAFSAVTAADTVWPMA